MRKMLWLFLFALPVCALAQPSNPSVRYVSSAPSGACSQAPPVQVLNSSGAVYTCNNGTWGAIGGTGSGTVSGQASGVIPLGTSATVIGAQSHMDDGVSAATTITSTEEIVAPSVATGIPSAGALAALPAGANGLACDESATAGVPAAGVDYIRCSTAHQFVQSLNGAAETPFGAGGTSGAVTNITGSSQVTVSGCTQSASTGGVCAISGTSTSSVTISAIPSTYLHLRVMIYGVSTSGTPNVTLAYNSGSNYASQGYFQQAASSPIANQGTSQSSCIIASLSTAIGAGDFTVLGYSDTNFWKMGFYNAGLFTSISSNTSNFADQGPCVWNSTAAITSVTIATSSADFGNATKIVLYGIN